MKGDYRYVLRVAIGHLAREHVIIRARPGWRWQAAALKYKFDHPAVIELLCAFHDVYPAFSLYPCHSDLE